MKQMKTPMYLKKYDFVLEFYFSYFLFVTVVSSIIFQVCAAIFLKQKAFRSTVRLKADAARKCGGLGLGLVLVGETYPWWPKVLTEQLLLFFGGGWGMEKKTHPTLY